MISKRKGIMYFSKKANKEKFYMINKRKGSLYSFGESK